MNKSGLRLVVWATVSVQLMSAVLYIGDFIFENYTEAGARISWELHEIIEITTAVMLVLGVILGVTLARRLLRRNNKVEEQLRVVSGEFQTLLNDNFAAWNLSPSERDVAYFAIKGLSNSEISGLRGTSEGTVKAQMNAVYKKAGIESRTQLLGAFIEELLATESDPGRG